jgi:exodeoxyribonuclease V beta subunit
VPLSGGAAAAPLCSRFEKFTPEALSKGTRRGQEVPAHAFFEACGTLSDAHAALMDAYARTVTLMKVRLLEYCNAELKTRKERRALQSYDDLLLNLRGALAGERGPALIEALRERYAAALIDEFQDTDPVQYDIFATIYRGTSQPVFLVAIPSSRSTAFEAPMCTRISRHAAMRGTRIRST